ncbi:TetR/AcrR family transcriptional regulator [Mesorhizobium sp. M0700]|uniref:TetR/AcrR family transcriptional regulator n=2 Tax=Mesorhizobium TaxID=68287 RepID=UPI003339950E
MGTEKTIDRRVARTRSTLHHALITLILRKGYEAITVEDICNEANIGRSTFYAHFSSKDDLKRSGLDDHLRAMLVERQRHALAAPGELKDRSLGFVLGMFEHAREHIDLYRALAGGRGGTIVLGSIREILCDLVRAELAANKDRKLPDVVPNELIVQFVVGAFLSVLIWWLDGGAKLPPQQVDQIFRRLATEGVPSA